MIFLRQGLDFLKIKSFLCICIQIHYAMMKYPIGIQSFDRIIEDGFVYVDKTDLIYKLVKDNSIYFLSRPRRFGKSLLVSTLKCYFQGRKELFRGLAIDKLETEWAEYPIFHVDFNGTNFTQAGSLEDIVEGTVSTWEKEYGRTKEFNDIGKRFAYVLQQAHKRYGRRCVVLIDEYDKPILDVLDTGYTTTIDGEKRLLEDVHREILKGFYSTFKLADEDLQFVLLTGVTKFSQVSVFSGFNQPADISMAEQYETLCGITQEELEHYFAEPIEALAKKYRTTPEGMKTMLKHRYDGYHFSDNLTDVYNPFSLLNAFSMRDLRDYWFASGTPTYLIRLLNHTQEDLNELTGRYYSPEEFIDYKADVEKPLPMIYQSGERKFAKLDTERGDCPSPRRYRAASHVVHFLPCRHSLYNAEQAGKGTLLPLYVLSYFQTDKRLYGLYRERAEPRAVRLHCRDGRLHLHLRVQARRVGRRGIGTDRSKRLCPSVRGGQAQAI